MDKKIFKDIKKNLNNQEVPKEQKKNDFCEKKNNISEDKENDQKKSFSIKDSKDNDLSKDNIQEKELNKDNIQKPDLKKESIKDKDLNKKEDKNFCFCDEKDNFDNCGCSINDKSEKNKSSCSCDEHEEKEKEIEDENISKNAKEKEINFEDIIMKLKQDNAILEEKFSKLQKEMIDNKLKYQADLENFRKRIQKEKEISIKYSSLELIREILVPLEQLTKVLDDSKNKEEDSLLKRFLLGFQMINQQIQDILKKDGVREIETIGKQFDPKFHFSIEKISDKNKPNNIVVDEFQKGFVYKDLGREMMPNYE
ncbi:nucleotide exchange factor GrpE [Candidatus Phytoplasma palmae]|uniref:nucleotide exchange factor GrpE n=1 Tax=Candidatus Phytoplasma palmae TaxID=85624 RepID=UPI0039908110